MNHKLKTDPTVFQAVFDGLKTHEICFNDRDFKVGDCLELLETKSTGNEMRNGAPLEFTGRTIERTVSHVLSGYGLIGGWVILSFAPPLPQQGGEQTAGIPELPSPWTKVYYGGEKLTDAGEVVDCYSANQMYAYGLKCRYIDPINTFQQDLMGKSIPDAECWAAENKRIVGDMWINGFNECRQIILSFHNGLGASKMNTIKGKELADIIPLTARSQWQEGRQEVCMTYPELLEFSQAIISQVEPQVKIAGAIDNSASLLQSAIKRMDTARRILTDNNPRPNCNWGMLDTSDLIVGQVAPQATVEVAVKADNVRPTDDDLWEKTLRDRDAYHEWADQLAEAIAKYLKVEIGEHSNANLPWSEALFAIEAATLPTSKADTGKTGHPMQPLVTDDMGTIRFKENAIVSTPSFRIF